MMKTKHDIKDKSSIVKAAQTLGADVVADEFWADVQENIRQLSGEVRPDEVQPRKTRTV